MNEPRPVIRWKYQTGGRLGRTSPAVAADGTIYVGDHDGCLYSISGAGKLLWRRRAAGRLGDATGSIADDGTIVVAAETGQLYAFSPAGEICWSSTRSWLVVSSPVITSDGRVIVGVRKQNVPAGQHDWLMAADLWGNTVWELSIQGDVGEAAAIAADGTIWFGTHRGYIYAVTPDGSIRWRFRPGGRISSAPALTAEGLVLFGTQDGCLYAISPDAEVVWKYPAIEIINQSSPSIAADGTICVGCWDHCLHAISSEGRSKWKFHTERPVSSSAAIAADGTIYFSSQDAHCYALHPDGSLKWKLRTDSPMTSSPAITDAGDVVICNQNRSVLVLDEQNGGPASSAWPMLLGNARHNGRMEEGRIRRKGLEQPQVISNPDNPACETQSLSPQGIACQNRKRLRNRF